MSSRLLLDEMYPPAIAEALCAVGFDVVAVAADRELIGSDDATVLALATSEHRCLVTENIQDFAVLARYAEHAGLLFVNGRSWPRDRKSRHKLIKALQRVLENGLLPESGEISWLH